MKRTTLLLLAGCLTFAACNDENTAQTKSAVSYDSSATADSRDTGWVALDSAAEMQAYMKFATPGEPHKQLAQANGNWNADITVWMKIGAEPLKSKGGMSTKMMMDGRYQMSSFDGDFAGMPFNGMAITGYDNTEKKYVSTWIDNMGTGILQMDGVADETKKPVTYTGSMKHPLSGKQCNMKQVITQVDANNQLMELYGPDPKTGKMFKNMEIKLTKK